MRQASLKIVRQENASSVFWSIYVPAYLNPIGKAGKMYFPAKADAERDRQQLMEAVSTQSRVLMFSNALRALEKLADAGAD